MTEQVSSAFRRGGDTMGAKVRAFDWAATPLGAIDTWPGALRVSVDLMMASKFPTCLFWGPDLIAIYNDAYRVILGQKPEALGQPMRVTWREAWDGLKPIADKALAGESTFIEDFPVQIDRHGYLEDTYFTFCYSPVFDEHGEVVGMLDTVIETTAKVMGEQRARDERERQRRLLQQMPGFVGVLNGPDHVFEYVNDAYRQISGPRDFLGRPVREVFPELEGQGFFELLDGVYTTGRAVHAEAIPIDLAGEAGTRFIDLRCEPIRDAAGHISGVFVGGYDVTERKRAESALQASEARLKELNADLEQRVIERTLSRGRTWQLSPELLGVINGDGYFEVSNPAWATLLGWSEREVAGTVFFDFVHPDDQARTRAAWDDAMQRGLPALRLENRYRVKGGGWRWLSWVAMPQDGKVYCSARDIQQDKDQQAVLAAAQDALRQSQKLEAIGQLTGGVAHDFNNLLTIISSSVALLRKPGLPDDRRQRFTEAISKAVGRGAKLTGQLLAFARRQTLTPSVFDVGHNVRSIMEMIDTLVGTRIDIEVSACTAACHVNADPSQFDTAIVNMVINARDAMDGAGRLGITVDVASAIPAVGAHPAKLGDYVAIAISDTGTGIAPGDVDRIFEPFYTTKAIGHGTGLGLSQVFGFAKQSGGEVQVQSTVGAGSTFTLYLPRAHPAGADAAAPAGHTSGTPSDQGLGELVLVVEDNLDVAVAVEATLGELGYRTVLARSAAQALARLDEQGAPFAAVFSDVVMAGMDGIALGREIRRRRPSLPVILSSGYSHVLAQERDHGFELLPKPYALDELARAMRRAIHGPAAGAAAQPRGPTPPPLLQSLLNDAEAERARLAELEALQVLDTAEETAYNDLTRMAAEVCGAPVALLSLIDQDRQWFKARVGIQARQTPREHAFCAHAIQDPDHVMVVPDATLDARFATNPLVTGDPNIRFYAGAPLVTGAGHAIGTLCVLSPTPRDIDPKQMEMLQFLAGQIVQRLERRVTDAALHEKTG